ncbi:MAP kinase [Acrasis kona]|uniref:MAP kinase n=1 Tax=Acrasis kona TaxID=1008807 RepID=A0AAW2ZI38_9EUKA
MLKERLDIHLRLDPVKKSVHTKYKESPVNQIINQESFLLSESYKLQRIIESGVSKVTCSGTLKSNKNDSPSEKVYIKKHTNVFHEKSTPIDFHKQLNLYREAQILSFVKHPNISRLVDIPCPTSKKEFHDVYFVTDLSDVGSIKILLKNPKLDDRRITSFMYQILSAVQYLHSADIVHGSLCPKNITINCNGVVQVRGLKSARPASTSLPADVQNTASYTSPEELMSLAVDLYSDIWSVGCILAEMLLKKVLFDGVGGIKDYICDMMRVTGTVINEHFSNLDLYGHSSMCSLSDMKCKYNPLLVDLLQKMLCFEGHDRITAVEAMRHPVFSGIHKEGNVVWSASKFNWMDEKELFESECIKNAMYKLISN